VSFLFILAEWVHYPEIAVYRERRERGEREERERERERGERERRKPKARMF